MSGRIIAIGDIHGCTLALAAVLDALIPRPDDTIVALGDYVDRGPDVPGTLERLIELGKQCSLIPILGNHDEMVLEIMAGNQQLLAPWLSFGGDATLAAYGCRSPSELPQTHLDFLANCHEWCEMDQHFFVHASYLPDIPLDDQPPSTLRWESLRDDLPGPHCSGKIAVAGHTAQPDGRILNLTYLQCIDTCCYGEGCLTAMDVHSGQLWQADKEGKMIED
jgi:calcineurin-like phosphoesterase family protein